MRRETGKQRGQHARESRSPTSPSVSATLSRAVSDLRPAAGQLALQYGVPLVPVYNFGETDMYTTYSWMLAARMWICKNLRVAIPLVRGIGPTILPRRVPLTCIIGKPITVKKDPEPTPAAVDALHEVFEAALRELFDKHKSKHARDGAELVIH